MKEHLIDTVSFYSVAHWSVNYGDTQSARKNRDDPSIFFGAKNIDTSDDLFYAKAIHITIATVKPFVSIR